VKQLICREFVEQHDVCSAKRGRTAQRNQVRIAGAGADKNGASHRLGLGR
jgi:hypothetical protein